MTNSAQIEIDSLIASYLAADEVVFADLRLDRLEREIHHMGIVSLCSRLNKNWRKAS